MDLESLPDTIFQDESTKMVYDPTPLPKTERGIGYEYFTRMQDHKDKVFHIIAATGETDTFSALLQRCIRTALHLKKRNLSRSDVIGLCSYNQIHNTVPWIAGQFLGIPVASIDPTFTVMEASYTLKLVKPKIMFVIPEFLDIITESLEEAEIDCELVVYGDDVDLNKHTSFKDFLEEIEEEESFEPVIVDDLSDTAVIFFSSGTTGFPKGICSSHKAIDHQAHLMNIWGVLGPDALILQFATLYWVSAVLLLTGSVYTGSARLVVQQFDVQQIWHWLSDYKVTLSLIAPVYAYDMLKVGRPDGIDTSSLHALITAGAPFSIDRLEELRDLLPGTFISQAYGSSEVSGLLTYFNLNRTKDKLLLHYKPGSCGRPSPGFEFKIVDPDTDEVLDVNQQGELRINSDFLLTGYYGQDSSGAFDEDGLLRTGDIAYYDEDYCIFIVSRIKELLKFRSQHVPPAVVESVLQTHPAVKQSVVIGIPDERDGDHPMAVIVLHEDFKGQVKEQEIISFIAERMNDTHRLRGGVKFVDELPMTPSGKFKTSLIRDMVLEGTL